MTYVKGIPIISEKADVTLAEMKVEYVDLLGVLDAKVFPDGGTGWAGWVLNRIDDRLNFLRTRITDIVCEVQNE